MSLLWLIGRLLLAGLLVAPVWPSVAQEEAASFARPRLDAIQDDLVHLRFEQALSAIETLFEEPGLDENDRAEALRLRAQAHLAVGDLAAVEEDYRQILRLRPDFVPDTRLTPQKALDRFREIQEQLIGRLAIGLEPPDAQVSIDGRPVELAVDTTLALFAGEHVVEARRVGFDSELRRVLIVADREERLDLRLVPNARTVVVVTEPDGVEVQLNGEPVGRTTRPATGWYGAPAELSIENLPLGEHVFELRKPCYRTERRREFLTVDLNSNTPRVLPVTRMLEARSTLVFRDGPEGAEIFVDGGLEGRLPREPLDLCPGSHRIEIRHCDRTVFASLAELVESEERVLRVEPRPNVTLVGAESWPTLVASMAEDFNTTIGDALPPRTDPSTARSWAGFSLPPGTDLALAAATGEDRVYLYSPALGRVELLTGSPDTARPNWTRPTFGLDVVDSERGGAALVVGVARGGPAAETGLGPGDRIASLGGVEIGSAAEVRVLLRAASTATPIELAWTGPDGRAHTGRLHGRSGAELPVGAADGVAALIRAAWASVDAACDDDRGQIALANLALLQAENGRHEQAVLSWRRVLLPERAGIGRGTVQYYLGRELEILERRAEAIRAFETAAQSEGTVLHDDGPRVAPAARDRLAEIGTRPANAR